MRKTRLSVRVFCALIVVIFSVSCAGTYHRVRAAYPEHVVLSDSQSGNVATIRGGSRTLAGLMGEYCWITYPAAAKRVTVTAGMVDIIAVCETETGDPGSMRSQASFHFDALAGHEYLISPKCDGCLRLSDITAKEVIAESPICMLNVKYGPKCEP